MIGLLPVNVWGMPTPLDLIAWAAVAVALGLWLTVMVCVRHVSELGPWWVPCWAVAIKLSIDTGRWGSRKTVKVRRGNDAWEYDPTRRGAKWLGFAGAYLSWLVKSGAWISVLAEIGGYGTALVLVLVALVWRWMIPIVAVYGIVRALDARRARLIRARRQQRSAVSAQAQGGTP